MNENQQRGEWVSEVSVLFAPVQVNGNGWCPIAPMTGGWVTQKYKIVCFWSHVTSIETTKCGSGFITLTVMFCYTEYNKTEPTFHHFTQKHYARKRGIHFPKGNWNIIVTWKILINKKTNNMSRRTYLKLAKCKTQLVSFVTSNSIFLCFIVPRE